MKDQSKTKQALVQKQASLRERITELEQSESERNRVNDLLQLHSEILAHMVESVHLIRVDDGVIVYTNLRFDSVFGYDPDELVGKHVSIINAPGEKTPEEVANEIIKNLNQAGVWKGEVHNIRKDGTSFWCYANVSTFKHPQYGSVWISVNRDITEHRQAEKELLEKSKALEELNIALKVLIDQYKNDQRELEERIVSNIRVRIIPYIERIKQTSLDIGQAAIIEIIERSFRDISSPFLKLISSEHCRFTPKEIEIVSLIKDGKTTKEIAQILGIGKRTADSYRDNIRGKLGLANKKINLRTYLLSIANT